MGRNKVEFMTVTVGRGTTSQQRRESVAERLSAMGAVLGAFDADLAALPLSAIGVLDLYGLRGIVRALLPLAVDDPTFDVTVTVGPTGAAVRVRHQAGLGPTARLVAGPGVDDPPPASPPSASLPSQDSASESSASESSASPVAWELAELLRRGEVGPR
jgi:hypothetical protein